MDPQLAKKLGVRMEMLEEKKHKNNSTKMLTILRKKTWKEESMPKCKSKEVHRSNLEKEQD